MKARKTEHVYFAEGLERKKEACEVTKDQARGAHGLRRETNVLVRKGRTDVSRVSLLCNFGVPSLNLPRGE